MVAVFAASSFVFRRFYNYDATDAIVGGEGTDAWEQ
jgi:hypothetical protein